MVNIQNENANNSIFEGNTNAYDKVINTFAEPVIARTISLHPVTWYNKVALRWELIGCGKHGFIISFYVLGPSTWYLYLIHTVDHTPYIFK